MEGEKEARAHRAGDKPGGSSRGAHDYPSSKPQGARRRPRTARVCAESWVGDRVRPAQQRLRACVLEAAALGARGRKPCAGGSQRGARTSWIAASSCGEKCMGATSSSSARPSAVAMPRPLTTMPRYRPKRGPRVCQASARCGAALASGTRELLGVNTVRLAFQPTSMYSAS